MNSAISEDLWHLSDALLQSLGRCNRADYLARVLEPFGVKSERLRRAGVAKPYPVSLTGHGASLMLQCVNPDAAPDRQAWGLHSFTLEAGRWQGSWPRALDPANATPEAVVKLLANPDDEEILCTPQMTCFAIAGPAGQSRSLVALFDQRSQKFASLTLVRTSEWVFASVLPPWR